MSVHPVRKSGRIVGYQVRWREGDRNRSRNFDAGGAGKKLAGDFDTEMRRLRQAGELVVQLDRRRLTVEDLYWDWLERVAPGLAAKTRQTYATQLALRVLPDFGHRRVSQIEVRDVERWIAKMRAAGDRDPTILMACAVLQALLTMAVRDGVIAVNPVAQARKPRAARTRNPHLVKPISVERMRAFLIEEATPRDVLVLELLAYAGLRPESEAVALPWRRVRDRSLLVQDTKRKRERSVMLLAPLAESLAAARSSATGPLVVPTSAGGAWSEHDWRNWRRRVFAPAATAAGLPADTRPRDLRGSFVSLLVHEGRNIVEVARQVGHSPEVCLRDYAQVFDEQDPDHRKPAGQVIAEARFAVRVAGMRPWAVETIDSSRSGGHSSPRAAAGCSLSVRSVGTVKPGKPHHYSG